MRAAALTAALAVVLAGCGSHGATRATGTAGTRSVLTRTIQSTTSAGPDGTSPLSKSLRLTSSAFRNGGRIPTRFTCDGRNLSLPLSWSGIPRRTRELLLEMRDPDAPTANFVHWAVADIVPRAGTIAAGQLPPGAVQGRNSFGTIGYRGPCPPRGSRPHLYVITLSALLGRSGVSSGFSPDQAVRSIELGVATLTGTYGR